MQMLVFIRLRDRCCLRQGKKKNAAELINSSAFVDKHLKIFIFYRAVDKFEHEEDQSKTPKGDKYYAGLVTYFARLFSPTKSES